MLLDGTVSERDGKNINFSNGSTFHKIILRYNYLSHIRIMRLFIRFKFNDLLNFQYLFYLYHI